MKKRIFATLTALMVLTFSVTAFASGSTQVSGGYTTEQIGAALANYAIMLQKQSVAGATAQQTVSAAVSTAKMQAAYANGVKSATQGTGVFVCNDAAFNSAVANMAAQANGVVCKVFNLTFMGQANVKFKSGMQVSLVVPNLDANQTYVAIHKAADGTVETIPVSVVNGKAVFTVNNYGPTAIVAVPNAAQTTAVAASANTAGK